MSNSRIGHHPDPLIDAEVEIERLEGLLYEARAGLHRGLDFQSGTPNGISIKRDLRSAIERTGGFFESKEYRIEHQEPNCEH